MFWRRDHLPGWSALCEKPLTPRLQARRWLRRLASAAMGLLLLLALAGDGHSQTETEGRMPGPSWGPPSDKPDRIDNMIPLGEGNDFMHAKLLMMLNSARQESLVKDTAKLLKLARQLNTEVAATNESSFTDEQLHKIAEIEKLARHVKEEMSLSVRDLPVDQYPF